VGALDWAYDWLGDGTNATGNGGPLTRVNETMPWVAAGVPNVAYSMHAYQHGSCCGAIGVDADASVTDPYESAFCMYPPVDGSGQPVASGAPLPIPSTTCDDVGYTTTQNKKSPPCMWAPYALPPGPPVPGGTCSYQPGMNNGGTNIYGSPNATTDAAGCCAICKATPACVGFAYIPGNGQCWPKSVVDPPTPDGAVISGTLSSSSGEAAATPGLCAGDRTVCQNLTQAQCEAVQWSAPTSGGWSSHVLPMAAYGPIIATELGTFDCSSPFTAALLAWFREFNVSYTAWALWPQDEGGPGAGACGYPSVIMPTPDLSDGFGKGPNNCLTIPSCKALVAPLPWSAALVAADIKNMTGRADPRKREGWTPGAMSALRA
jgi:hypothetical protein